MLYAKDRWKNILINVNWDQPEAQDNCPKAVTYTKKEVTDLFRIVDGFDNVIVDQDFIFS